MTEEEKQKPPSPPLTNQEHATKEPQRSSDRTVTIFAIVVASFGVAVTLVGLAFAVVGSYAFFGFEEQKKTISNLVVKMNEKMELIKEDAIAAKRFLDQIEEDVNGIRDGLELNTEKLRESIAMLLPPPGTDPDVTEKPAEEVKEKLAEHSKATDRLKKLGSLLKPDDANAWSNKGYALGKLGRYEEALKAIDKAIELKPDLAFAWRIKGVALNFLGKYEKAITCLDKAMELDPKDSYAWSNKGVCIN